LPIPDANESWRTGIFPGVAAVRFKQHPMTRSPRSGRSVTREAVRRPQQPRESLEIDFTSADSTPLG